MIGYDVELTRFLGQGFTFGFDIGYRGPLPDVKPKNLASALEFPRLVDDKLKKELILGRISGPFSAPPFSPFRTSPIGLVEKKTAGKFRFIHHLSHPKGNSINDGISDEFAHVSYQTIDHAAEQVVVLGKGCFMAKTDIADAFRIVPLHPSQYPLLGFMWRDHFYYDRCLPMGCRSSCRLFQTLSEALRWVCLTKLKIGNLAHILDDFLFLAEAEYVCQQHLDAFVSLCQDLGIPLAPEKTVGPSQTITFLGIEIDSVNMELRLPQDKLEKCSTLIQQTLVRRKVTLRELQALVGLLNFACGVVVPGRPFLRRLINLTKKVTEPHFFITLNKEAKEDLDTWLAFLKTYNGRSLLLADRWRQSNTPPMFSDSSGRLGFGVVWGDQWFAGAWNDEWRGQSIALLEFYPIALAVSVWAKAFSNRCIVFHSDNEAVVHIINRQTSTDNQIMCLLRQMVLTCLQHNILFTAVYFEGRKNVLADALSGFQVGKFKQLAPGARPFPVPIPPLPPLPH